MRILLALLVVLTVSGCGKKAPEQVSSVIVSEPTASVVEYQIPIKPTDQKIETPGKDEKDLLAEIDIAPSTKPTKLKLYKKDLGLLNSLTRKKDEAKNPIDLISDNKDVKAKFKEVRPWWEYVAWLVGILGSIALLIKTFGDSFSWLSGPLKIVKKIFGFWRKS